jgi:hypothetical protein
MQRGHRRRRAIAVHGKVVGERVAAAALGERRRFVDVQPDRRDAALRRADDLLAPPRARGGARHIGERGGAGPRDALRDRALRVAHEVIPGDARVVDVPPRIDLDARILDRDEVDAARRQPIEARLRECLRIHGERAEAAQVLDVEPQRRERELLGGEPRCDRLELRAAAVAPAALMKAERPARRYRGPAGQLRVAIDHVGHARAGEQVLIQRARAIGGDRVAIAGEVDHHAARLVGELAVRDASRHAQLERDALVQRILIGRPATVRGVVRVGVPERPRAPAAIEAAGALAEAIDAIAVREAFELRGVGDGERRRVVDDHGAVRERRGDAAGVVDLHDEIRRAQRRARAVSADRRRRFGSERADDRPRSRRCGIGRAVRELHGAGERSRGHRDRAASRDEHAALARAPRRQLGRAASAGAAIVRGRTRRARAAGDDEGNEDRAHARVFITIHATANPAGPVAGTQSALPNATRLALP